MVAVITFFQNKNQQKRKSLNKYDWDFSLKNCQGFKKIKHITSIKHVPKLINFFLFPKTFKLIFTVKKYFTSYYLRK